MEGTQGRFGRLGPDVAIGVVALAAVLLLPVALGGFVHERTFAQYGLFWRELTGDAGLLPLETPKPLTTLRAALGEVGFFAAAAALFAVAPVALGRLSKRLYGTRVVGVGAVVLLLLGNRYFLSGPLLDGYWPLPYLGLTTLAAAAFAAGRYGAALAATGTAGLVRPDAWGYALLLLGLILVLDRDAWRPAYATALAAVPAWMLFDLGLTGDPFYSLSTTERYAELLGPVQVTPGSYWGELTAGVAEACSVPVLLAGFVGLVVALARARGRRRWSGHAPLAALALSPLVGYWGLSAIGSGFVLHVRFFLLPIALLGFYALALPLEVLRWRRDREPSAEEGGRAAAGGSAASGRRLRSGTAAAATVLAVAIAWAQTGSWARARELHRVGLTQGAARADAVAMLREGWVGTSHGLLAGRSLELFAYRLGPEAARRMLRFREVGRHPERIRRAPAGLAVYLAGDTSGYGTRFAFLRVVETRDVPELGLRFEPRARLRYGGHTVGAVYAYRPIP